jgi:hypothetical protein
MTNITLNNNYSNISNLEKGKLCFSFNFNKNIMNNIFDTLEKTNISFNDAQKLNSVVMKLNKNYTILGWCRSLGIIIPNFRTNVKSSIDLLFVYLTNLLNILVISQQPDQDPDKGMLVHV